MAGGSVTGVRKEAKLLAEVNTMMNYVLLGWSIGLMCIGAIILYTGLRDWIRWRRDISRRRGG